MAPLTRMAFSKALRVRMRSMRRSSCTMSTILLPARCAVVYLRESTAGMAAAPGRVRPNASLMEVMVDAVPITMQCPALRDIHDSASMKSCNVISPERTYTQQQHITKVSERVRGVSVRAFSLNPHTWVPEPICWSLHLPFSIGPPGTTMVGRLTLSAPITNAGVVLSHPVEK